MTRASSRLGSTDVLIVLGHELHVRNFAGSGWLAMLLDRGLRAAVVAPGSLLPDIDRLTGGRAVLRPLEPLRAPAYKMRALSWLRLASWVQAEHLVEYRLKLQWERPTLDQKIALRLFRRLAASGDPEAVARRVVQALPVRPAARRLVAELDPHVVLWPSTISYKPECDIIQAALAKRRPVLMFEGSWDNLASKGAIWPRPDRILVWGEFSAAMARDRHGFDAADVAVTGPPHFDVYGRTRPTAARDEWMRRHNLDPARRLLMFGGSTVELRSEVATLQLLSGWISSGVLPPSYVWYRPHPRAHVRRPALPAEVAGIPHVIVDPGLPASKRGAKVWTTDPEDALQRADAIAASDVMLSTFSTVVVEAALLGKPSVLLAFGFASGKAQPRPSPFGDFAHVRYLSRSPWIRYAYSPDELEDVLPQRLAATEPGAAKQLREFALTIANVDDGQARARILREVEAMARHARWGAA